MKAFSLPAVFLVLALSGCAGNGTPSADGAKTEPVFADDAGSVLVTVRDDELLGIQGAQVGIPALGLEAETGVDGRALLGPIPPGTHEMFATALGYGSRRATVEVAAGVTVERTVTLPPLAIAAPRMERTPFSGRFECAFTLLDIQWRECDSNRLVWPTSDNSELFTKPANVTQIVAELRWQAASAGTGQNLDFSIMQGKPDRQGCQWYANDYGPTPLKLVVNVGETYANPHSASAVGSCDDTVIDPKDTNLMVKVHSSPAYVAGEPTAGVTYGQRYDGFVSLFYGMQAPDGYTAFADG